jgi:signal peptidase I
MSKKNNIGFILGFISIGIILLIIGFFTAVLYYQIFPYYTESSPTTYFPSGTNSIDLSRFQLFTMQQTPSMLPTIPYNSTVIVLPISQVQNISVRDIIAFYYPGRILPVAHRVVEIRNVSGQEEYLTKGDNVKYSDQILINKTEIIGKVVGVLY